MPTGGFLGIDARTIYAQLLAIADRARQLRKESKMCTVLEVDDVLEAYSVARTLCHELTCGEKASVSILDLGRILDHKDYTQVDLRGMLASVEAECFKGIGALARIVALTVKEEKHNE
jgi:hypothetical protein